MKRKLLVTLLALLCVIACSFAFSACGEAHKHTFSEDWKSDATNHWHEATCGDYDVKGDLAPHIDEDNNGECDVCKYTPMDVIVGGTYYFSENNVIENQIYVDFRNDKWTDDEGQSGDYEVSGNTITLYIIIEDETTEFATGTVNGNDITLDFAGTNVVYRKGEDINSKPKEKTLAYSLSEDKSYYIVEGIGELTGDIIVPDEFKRKPVREIAESAFENSKSLTSIVIGNNVAVLGAKAFCNCTNLTSVEIKGAVEELTADLFSGCGKLKDISLPLTLLSIKSTAFSECDEIENVYYSGNISDWCAINFGANPISRWAEFSTEKNINLIIGDEIVTEATISTAQISDNAFKGYKNLKSITLTPSVERIGKNAFYRCDNLQSFDMENASVISIGERAFYFCGKLSELTIPDSVKKIGNYAFSYCGITSVKIGNGVTSIGEEAFASCDKLATVQLGNSLTEIGDMAFYMCAFTNVTIPSSVMLIGSETFCGTPLENVHFGNTHNWVVNNLPPVNLTSEELSNPTTAAKYLTTSILQNGYMSNSWERSYLIFTLSSDGKSYSVKNDGTTTAPSITIPSEYDGKPVIKIDQQGFIDCSDLKSILIPESIIYIGDSAFANCYGTKIYCEAASKPNGWDYDWKESYQTVIWDCKHNNKDDDERIIFTDVDEINYALEDGKATIIAQSQSISGNLKIPSTVTYNSTVYAVAGIEEYAFTGCKNLTSVTIPESVDRIDSYAFEGCRGLTIYCETNRKKSNWSTSWNSYWNNEYGADGVCPVIWNCKNNNKDEDGYEYTSINGLVYSLKDGIATVFVQPYNLSGSIIIPSNITYKNENYRVTKIANRAFYNCNKIISMIIPDSIAEISENAFENCINLTSVTIPDGVTEIGNDAFAYCEKLTSVIIPDSVIKIGEGAFVQCRLIDVTIGKGVTEIGWGAFLSNYTFAKNIYYKGNLESWCKIKGLEHIPESILYIDGKKISGELVIPNSVTEIGDYAFSECSGLTSITIPDSVSEIGDSAFSGCSSLTSVTIPNGVTEIGRHAFYGCSSLTSVTIPDSVTEIGYWVFAACSSLTSVTIPDSVTEIGDSAFAGCSNITSIKFLGTRAQWKAIEKHSGWNYNTGEYTVHCSDGDIAKADS